MNTNFYNQENIDAYLKGKLSGRERSLFEDGMSKDPLIKNEILLQKDIIESLKEVRRAELKQRLNKVQVPSQSSFNGLKIAASVLLAALLGTGTYFYMSAPETSKAVAVKVTAPVPAVPSAEEAEAVINSENSTEQATASATTSTETSPGSIASKRRTTVEAESNTASVHSEAAVEAPKEPALTQETSSAAITEPTPADFSMSDDFNSNNKITMPNAEIAHRQEGKLEHPTVKVINKKSFDYQYYNNKLFLYGEFNSKPYELLELNSPRGRELYLYFENAYYKLNSNQINKAPLKEIKEKAIIRELELLKK